MIFGAPFAELPDFSNVVWPSRAPQTVGKFGPARGMDWEAGDAIPAKPSRPTCAPRACHQALLHPETHPDHRSPRKKFHPPCNARAEVVHHRPEPTTIPCSDLSFSPPLSSRLPLALWQACSASPLAAHLQRRRLPLVILNSIIPRWTWCFWTMAHSIRFIAPQESSHRCCPRRGAGVSWRFLPLAAVWWQERWMAVSGACPPRAAQRFN